MRTYICPVCGSRQETELELPLFSEAQCKWIKCTACGKGALVGIGGHETYTNAKHLDVETSTCEAMYFSVKITKSKRTAEARVIFLRCKRKGFRVLVKNLRKILNGDHRLESVILTDRATDWYLGGNDDDNGK